VAAAESQVFSPPAFAAGRRPAHQGEFRQAVRHALAASLHVAQGRHRGGGDPIQVAEDPVFKDGGKNDREGGNKEKDEEITILMKKLEKINKSEKLVEKETLNAINNYSKLNMTISAITTTAKTQQEGIALLKALKEQLFLGQICSPYKKADRNFLGCQLKLLNNTLFS
jgi:hypothetical protein